MWFPVFFFSFAYVCVCVMCSFISSCALCVSKCILLSCHDVESESVDKSVLFFFLNGVYDFLFFFSFLFFYFLDVFFCFNFSLLYLMCSLLTSSSFFFFFVLHCICTFFFASLCVRQIKPSKEGSTSMTRDTPKRRGGGKKKEANVMLLRPPF